MVPVSKLGTLTGSERAAHVGKCSHLVGIPMPSEGPPAEGLPTVKLISQGAPQGSMSERKGYLCPVRSHAMGAGPRETDHEEGQQRVHEVIETEVFVETGGKALAGFR